MISGNKKVKEFMNLRRCRMHLGQLCSPCGTCQKVNAAKKGATARLCAEIEGKQQWLTVFTDIMKILQRK